jgi:hypothetical protein
MLNHASRVWNNTARLRRNQKNRIISRKGAKALSKKSNTSENLASWRLPAPLGRFPSATEGFVQGNEIGRHRRLALSERALRNVERALGVQDIKKII